MVRQKTSFVFPQGGMEGVFLLEKYTKYYYHYIVNIHKILKTY